MKPTITAFAIAALLSATSLQPLMAQDSGLAPAPVPADATQQQLSPGQKAQAGQPVLMRKPAPKRPAPDGLLVAGGIAALVAVIVGVGSGGGGNDNPSSP